MEATATLAVAELPTSIVSLEAAVDDAARLGREIAALETRRKALCGHIKAGLALFGARRFATAAGHTATVVESTSFRGDKVAADRLLPPELVGEIFRATTTSTLRVK